MKKISILVGAVVIIILGFYFFKLNPKLTTESLVKKSITSIVNMGISIEIPEQYSLSERNYPLSAFFAFYEINKPSTLQPPYLDSIAFYSEESLKNFIKKCDEECRQRGPDSPAINPEKDLELFYTQKEMFAKNAGYPMNQVVQYNNRIWLVNDEECIGDSCVIRYFTTFLGSIKVVISMISWPPILFPKSETIRAFEILNLKQQYSFEHHPKFGIGLKIKSRRSTSAFY